MKADRYADCRIRTGFAFDPIFATLPVTASGHPGNLGLVVRLGPSMNRARVVLLGTGTPIADPDRSGPSLALVVEDKAYVVDFGPGVVRRAAAAQLNGVQALRTTNLETAFLTHLHSDHTTGYPDLISTPWVLGRSKPIDVYGPPGLASMTNHILAAYEMDREIRVCGLEPCNPEGYGAVAHEIGPGNCYQDEYVSVEAFEVNHGDGWVALGYQFTTENRRIVISGDTAPIDSVIEIWKGCDLLVHEVYSTAGLLRCPREWQKYHSHMHTSSEQLAEIAGQVNPKTLLLTHILFWGSTEQELVNEITQGYDGEVICGEDLGVY